MSFLRELVREVPLAPVLGKPTPPRYSVWRSSSELLHNVPKNKKGDSGGPPSFGKGLKRGGGKGDPVQPANGQIHSLTGRMGSRGGWLVRDLYPEPLFPSSKAD